MWVKLKFKDENGKQFKSKKEMTVKEAIKLFKKELQNDDKIAKVWLTHFDGWRTYLHKILKEIKK